MDLKAEKVIGLNDWAKSVVAEDLCTSRREACEFGDGTYQTAPVFETAVPQYQKEEYDAYTGAFCDILPLYKYTMPNGRVYFEVVQKQPSDVHGLFLFLAFKNGRGELVQESLWSEDAMRKAAHSAFAAA